MGEYDLGGAFTGAPINQQISLWNDTANGWDHNGRASTSGYSLSGEFYVDNEHVYAMWVWFGVDASSAYGQFDFIQNLAFVDMSVAVPSITWELF